MPEYPPLRPKRFMEFAERDDGDIDAQATCEARAAIRRQRLGYGLEASRSMSAVDPASDPTVAVAIDHTRSDWTCTACGQSLGPLALNWRSCAHLVELPIVAALQTAGQLIRPSGPETAIVQREFVCPGCGSTPSVDGAMQQDPYDPSRQLPASTHVQQGPPLPSPDVQCAPAPQACPSPLGPRGAGAPVS